MDTKFFKLLLVIPLILFSCKGKRVDTQEGNQIKDEKNMESTFTPSLADLPEEPIFEIETSEGTIKVKLYKETPLHRDNFAKLALEGFYDGIRFHRVVNGFMIQAGNPATKPGNNPEDTGPGYMIPAEILPIFTHQKGALAAARIGDAANPERKSSGSQFYLVQSENGAKHLDGNYTIFGETLSGFDVIDKIAATQRPGTEAPSKDITIISIKAVIE